MCDWEFQVSSFVILADDDEIKQIPDVPDPCKKCCIRYLAWLKRQDKLRKNGAPKRRRMTLRKARPSSP